MPPSRVPPPLSQERAGLVEGPSSAPQQEQQQEEDHTSNLSLLERAEVDAILSEASVPGRGAGGVVGGDLDDRVAPGGADAAAIAAPADDGEMEEAEFLRALMADIGFGEDEVAGYSLEELLLLREVGVAS